jgi:hypothetical protein
LRAIHTTSDRQFYRHNGAVRVFPRLDEIATSGSFTGTVRSLCFAGKELLHVRLFQEHVEVADEIIATAGGDSAPHIIPYDAPDGSRRQKIYARLVKPVWQQFSDLDGAVVPMKIIRKVLKAEGLSEAQWVGRGVQVGAKAWEVLSRWQEAQGKSRRVLGRIRTSLQRQWES